MVLQKAMELFWQQGYEKTSMSDLVEHMGIHRKSIYDTFGEKLGTHGVIKGASTFSLEGFFTRVLSIYLYNSEINQIV